MGSNGGLCVCTNCPDTLNPTRVKVNQNLPSRLLRWWVRNPNPNPNPNPIEFLSTAGGIARSLFLGLPSMVTANQPNPPVPDEQPNPSGVSSCKRFLPEESLSHPQPLSNKKTRDQPNLSECHNCRCRIKSSNPKDRLRPLRSEWRIVLLCKNCYDRVESSQLCPFCFAEASDGCFRCEDCSRRVHRICALSCKGMFPPSYSASRVCLDCWLPEPLLKLKRLRPGLENGSDCKNKKIREAVMSSSKGSEAVMKDAEGSLETKVAAAKKAREKAVTKAVAAEKAVLLANSALDLVAEKCDRNGNAGVDDAQIAFQLHLAMNSSPRISKNSTAVTSTSLPLPRKCENYCRSYKLEMSIGDNEAEEEGSCSNNHGTDFNSITFQEQDEKAGLGSKAQDTAGLCQLPDIKRDRYLLKYSKRNYNFKGITRCRTRLIDKGCHFDNPDSTTEVYANCFNESRSSSGESFQCCSISLQASVCAVGSHCGQSLKELMTGNNFLKG